MASPTASVAALWLCAFGRAFAFAATAPLAGPGAVTHVLRAALGLCLAPAVAAHAAQIGQPAAPTVAFVENVLIGAAFGLAATMIASAASAAGSTFDNALASGIATRETIVGGDGGPFGRLYSLAFAAVFFSSGAMTMLCERFAISASTVTVSPTVSSAVTLARVSFESALTLAAPAIVAQMFGTITAAVLARAAPRVNGLMLASPIVTVILLLAAIAAAPSAIAQIVSLAHVASRATPL